MKQGKVKISASPRFQKRQCSITTNVTGALSNRATLDDVIQLHALIRRPDWGRSGSGNASAATPIMFRTRHP
eukprot:9562559-Prorocentrum_lima.AAC.1